jgi:tetratricopeptide (TPR) repeat protein
VSSVDVQPAEQSHPSGLARRNLAIQNLLLGFLLALAVVAVYYPVHWQPFANYDDPDYVSDNVHVRTGLTWTTVRWAMTSRDAANWHPVTWLSHALDVQLFGITPAGPHDVNVALHIVNALLLFWVLLRATGFAGRSWMVAALFALHPINVESVAWIAERKNLLSMMFFLLALDAYRRYAMAPAPRTGERDRRGWRFVAVMVLFALGLMAKPQIITFPFVLLLWDYWPLGRVAGAPGLAGFETWVGPIVRTPRSGTAPDPSASLGQALGHPADGEWREWRSLIVEKIPLFGLCLISAVFTVNAQAAGGATSFYPLHLRLENAIVSYARYLTKTVWPSHLTLFYPYPLKPYPLAEIAAAALLLFVISAGVFLARRRRYLTVGWLWFLGTLVPMIGLVQVGTQAMADRYAYLSFIGLFIMVCWLVADWAAGARVSPVLVRGVSVVVLAVLAFVAHRQVGFWNDHITLWTHAVEVTHDNWVAENNLGTALLKMTRVEEAIPHFRAAVALYPTDPNSNLNIGTYEQMHGNLLAAIERYKAAAGYARNPKTKARAYNNLGFAYKGIGDLTSARDAFEHAVEADPNYSGAWISLGIVAQRTGDLALAVKAYSHGVQVYPSDYGYVLLAGALQQSGEHAESRAAREKAERMSRNFGATERYADELLNH